MRKDELEKIKNMPKVVLHLHLDGSLRPETVYKWLKEEKKDITLEETRKKLMVNNEIKAKEIRLITENKNEILSTKKKINGK